MLDGFGFADFLFILLVGGVIYFFVYWFGPVRRKRSEDKSEQKQADSRH